MKDLKHLIYFENLLDNADNELVEQAKKDGKLTISVKIPVGCHATLHLPAPYASSLTENGTPIAEIGTVTMTERDAEIALGSGEYTFAE